MRLGKKKFKNFVSYFFLRPPFTIFVSNNKEER